VLRNGLDVLKECVIYGFFFRTVHSICPVAGRLLIAIDSCAVIDADIANVRSFTAKLAGTAVFCEGILNAQKNTACCLSREQAVFLF
jgi:hypothetical protein